MQHLKERETSLKDFLLKAEGQLKGIDESIQFTKQQIADEEIKLAEQKEQLRITEEKCGRKKNSI